MEYLFNGCESLSSLPDISKWNINNVANMEYMFSGCKSLSSLPDISKWNISIVIYMRGLFNESESLSYLPDISRWNTNNVINKDIIIYLCINLFPFTYLYKFNRLLDYKNWRKFKS